MRVTARPAAPAAVDGGVGSTRRRATTPSLDLGLEIAPPTRLDDWRARQARTRGPSTDRAGRDLGPARGMLTAVGLGAVLWTVLLVIVRFTVV